MSVFLLSLVGFLFFQGIFLIILLLRRRSDKSNFILVILILKYCLLMLTLLMEEAGLAGIFPDLLFLTGPLVYLYIRMNCCEKKSLKVGDSFFFIPFLLNFIPFFSVWIHVLDLLWTILFSSLALNTSLKAANKNILLVLFAGLLIFSSLFSFLDVFFLWTDQILASDISSLLLSVIEGGFIFLPSWFFLYGTPVISKGDKSQKSSLKYEKNLLDDSLLRNYYEKMDRMMKEDKLFKDPRITLTSLSEVTGISVGHLSQIINRVEEVNYFQYINRLRVEEVCRIFLSGDKRTVLEIMYESGFNSKTTFNKAFRSIKGVTPGEFRASLS